MRCNGSRTGTHTAQGRTRTTHCAEPHAQATGAMQQPNPGRTRFSTLSTCCCQILRECVFAAESDLASEAFSVTSATLSRKRARARRGERPPTASRPHRRTHSRDFWQQTPEAPPKPPWRRACSSKRAQVAHRPLAGMPRGYGESRSVRPRRGAPAEASGRCANG